MSLHFTLHVNGQSIGHTVAIRRLKPKTNTPRPNTICTYRASVFGPGQVGIRAEVQTATVKHRYGDGPIELVRKALNALQEVVAL